MTSVLDVVGFAMLMKSFTNDSMMLSKCPTSSLFHSFVEGSKPLAYGRVLSSNLCSGSDPSGRLAYDIETSRAVSVAVQKYAGDFTHPI